MSKKPDEAVVRNELSESAFFARRGEAPRPITSRAPEGGQTSELKVLADPRRELPLELQDLSETGYTSHSYGFTDEELRWLKQFCLDAGASVGRRIHHNTLIRALLRLADEEWKANPGDNRLSKLLSSLKD